MGDNIILKGDEIEFTVIPATEKLRGVISFSALVLREIKEDKIELGNSEILILADKNQVVWKFKCSDCLGGDIYSNII